MKRAWDPTTLTAHHWDGAKPIPGDGLQTRTGRRYLILKVIRRRDGTIRALECMVLPKDEPIEGRVFNWYWSPRGRRMRS